MKRSLRYAVAGVASLGLVGTAFGADLDVLRGSQVFAPSNPVYTDWSGGYVGLSGGGGLADANFGRGATDVLGLILPTTQTAVGVRMRAGDLALSSDNTGFTSFGGFAGYNSQ